MVADEATSSEGALVTEEHPDVEDKDNPAEPDDEDTFDRGHTGEQHDGQDDTADDHAREEATAEGPPPS